MKALNHPFLKSLAIAISLIAAATFAEGKKELANRSADKVSAFTSYHSADVIKNMISYTVSAAPVYASSAELVTLVKTITAKAELERVIPTATRIYNEMDLQNSGLSEKAFEYGWMGYYKLQKKGLLLNTNVLTICDFSQSSSVKRMYVIDLRSRKLLYRTFVAHGINSGDEYANSFSNTDESCKSSLGFYVTSNTYVGSNGLSLRIEGVDTGFNDHAARRNIVIHGATYVSLRILHKFGVMGTTFGCPAIPAEMCTQIIPAVKNRSCFFIYYPSKKYLTRSTVLNG